MNKQQFLDLSEAEQTLVLAKKGKLYLSLIQKDISVSFYHFKTLFIKIISNNGIRKVEVGKSTIYDALSEEDTLDF